MLQDKKEKNKLNKGTVFDFLLTIVCLIIFIITLYPLYIVLISSFSDAKAVLQGEILLFPKGFSLEGYRIVMTDARLGLGYINTVLYSVLGTGLNLLVTLPAAYVMSRKEFIFRRALNVFFVFTMFFNGGMIATYITMRDLNLVNNRMVFIIAFCLNVYNLVITRTFFEQSIPEEMREAALMDGCGHFRYFITCVLPLSKAIITVIALYYFVWHWNDFFMGLVYVREKEMLPLQNVLRTILLSNQTNAGGGVSFFQISLQEQIKYASIVVSTLPLLVIYPFLQKYFNKGVMLGAIKG